MKRIDLPVAELVRRYETGETAQEVGVAYGVSRSVVDRRLHEAGVKKRLRGGPRGNTHARGNKSRPKRGGPLHTDGSGYLQTYDREGNCSSVHRGCWEACYGPIPEGYIVHHINSERADNNIENLACMPDAEHKRLHCQEQRTEAGRWFAIPTYLRT